MKVPIPVGITLQDINLDWRRHVAPLVLAGLSLFLGRELGHWEMSVLLEKEQESAGRLVEISDRYGLAAMQCKDQVETILTNLMTVRGEELQ